MSDEEDYEFEYSDQEEDEAADQDTVAIEIENKYYGSKGLRDSDVRAAADGFTHILELEASKTDGSLAEWGFKSTKQLVKLSFKRGMYDQMLSYYSDMLRRIKSGVVTRNRAEKSINGILDLVSTMSDASHLSSFYDTTLEALAQGGGNERLAFKARTKQARLYLAQKDWVTLRPLLTGLRATLTNIDSSSLTGAGAGAPSTSGDMATQLLEVYALQVQMYSELRDTKRVAELVQRAACVRSAVPHPGITGILKEAAGKLNMRERAWEEARLTFQDAFKAFEEAGDGPRTLANLQYMLLANMLSNNRINPFDDQSSKAYERDPAIASMVALTDAYLAGDIAAFEPVLRAASSVSDGRAGAGHSSFAPASAVLDEFMRGYVNDLLSSMRNGVTAVLVAPYDRIRLDWLAHELGVGRDEAEGLVSGLILDGRLAGSIDQPNGILNLTQGVRLNALPADAGKGKGKSGSAGIQVSGASDTYAELASLASKLERLAGSIGGMVASNTGGMGGAGHGGMHIGSGYSDQLFG